MTGAWPLDQLDHINRNRADNRWANLRPATASQNAVNSPTPATNRSGCRGVRANGSGWEAAVRVNGKRICLGTFDDIKMAMLAYNAAAWKHYGKFAQLDPEFIAEFKRWRALRNLANHAVAA